MKHLQEIKEIIWQLYYEGFINKEEFFKIFERYEKRFFEYSNKRIEISLETGGNHIPRID